MSKARENYLKVALALLSMTFIIYIGTTLLKRANIDITEENLYTLSDGTKSLLAKLDSPIKLELYYSKVAANKGTEQLRAYNNHFRYVKELLRQYASHSKNNISLNIIDPRPDTVEEENAISYGLKGFNITETEKYFFGLVAESEAGSEKTIEFLDPSQKDKLEYHVTKLIYSVLNPRKKTIGIMSSMMVLKEDSNPQMDQIKRLQGKQVQSSWIITKVLQEFYNIKNIKRDEEKITGIDVLIIIHPRGFPEKTLFAIDQYLMRGGNILLFVDPNTISDPWSRFYGGLSNSPGPGFKKLMDKWGIELLPATFAGDKLLSGVGSFNPNMPPGKLLPILQCNELCTAPHKDGITSGINNSLFLFPGVLEVKDTDNIVHTPIMSTSPKGGHYRATPQALSQPNLMWDSLEEGKGPVIIAYKSVGKYATAFPSGIKESKKTDLIKESQKESAIITFSDVDFIADGFAFKMTFLGPTAENGNVNIFLNSVEALTGNTDLMKVRSKGRINRAFKVVQDIELEAEKKTSGKVKEINARITNFQNELNQISLRAQQQSGGGNIALLQNESVKKRKEVEKQIAVLRGELREVKREGREKIEGIGVLLRYLNTLMIPIIVVLVGLYYNSRRSRLMFGKARNAGADA